MADVVDILLRARMDASEVSSGVGAIQKQLQGLTLPKGLTEDLSKEFTKLAPLLKDYQKQLSKGFSSQKDIKNFNLLKEKIDDTLGGIKSKIQSVNKEEVRVKADTEQIKKLEQELDKAKEKLQESLNNVFKGTQSKTGIQSSIKEIEKALNATFSSGKLKFPALSNFGKELAKSFNAGNFSTFNAQITQLQNKIAGLSGSSKLNIAHSLGFDKASNDIKRADSYITSFLRKLSVKGREAGTIDRLRQQISELGPAIERAKLDEIVNKENAIGAAAGNVEQLMQMLNGVHTSSQSAASGMVSMNEQLNQLKTSTQYFFSLRNMINLLKRGVQEAVQTIKELDAAMTETAVVTNYSVADMWKMLPEYTAMANKLGATIKGAYETTTLYYQQGLDREAAFGIGEETIKMARIAGLDYAETTDMMTAALRGFNMELNNLSAQHINDVYSELAAKTASNTQEIGSAMERTASIAHSAGMSFEGTSAFLAQMIETTREAPENLGTAMKTIVARFQELKKDPLDMEEVDGELPDYNRVDTALKSIGVDLKNQRGEFRALDEVFLDIAQRWDSLDQRQQRYVATMAAGSRQQSRFIAMMSNYERTVELMDYANNSAGASQEQFNKTLDSFEAKANKLKNAWQQFLMGITDNKIIKSAVDLLTGLTTAINKIINTVSLGFGPLKSFVSLFTAFTALKVGGGLVNRLIGGLGGMLDPRSSFRKGFGVGATGFSSAQAAQISNPIVSVLEQIRSEVVGLRTKNNISEAHKDVEKLTPQQYLQNYKDANQKFRSLKAGNTLDDVVGTLKLTDEKQSQLILNNSPGVRNQIKRTFGKIMNNKAFDQQMQKSGAVMVDELFEGMQKKTISTKDGMAIFKDFSKAGRIIGTETAREFSIAYTKKLFENGNGKAIRQKTLNGLKIGQLNQQQLKEYFTDSKYGQVRLQEYREAFAKEKEAAVKQKFGGSFGAAQLPDPTRYERFAQTISAVGSGFTAAGQAASTFGMILNSMGLETVGAAFMSLGNIVSSVGMTISNMVPIIQNYGSKIVSVIGGALANPAFWAAAIPIGLVAGTAIANKVIEKKAKEAAEKVTKTYQDAMEDTSKKISTLETNKDILNSLSSGVDQFGNNVSLTNEEYEQFLSASKEVAEVSPSLIKGYTAQGDALVATGQALDDVIAKEKEYQELARANYVTSSSLQSLAEGVEVSDTYKKYKDSGITNVVSNNYSGKIQTDFGYLSDEIDDLANIFYKFDLNGNDIIKEVTGFNVDLNNVTQESALIIAKYSDEIQNMTLEPLREKLLTGEIDQEYYDKVESQLQDSMSAFTTGWSDLLTEAQPLTDAISQYLTSQNLDAAGLQLSEQFVYGFNEGLSLVSLDAISQGLSGAEIQQAARDYANSFKSLTGDGSKYAQIMEQVNKAQDEYLENISQEGAIDNYNNSVEDSVKAMREMAEEMDTSTEAGRQLQVMFNDTANDIENYASEVSITLGEALNTLSDNFAHARGAKEEFDKAIESGDYYTATKGFKDIYETTTNDDNMQGYGSNTFWTGAEFLLGEGYVNTHGLDQIKERLTEIEPLLADGAEGFNAFYDEIEKHKDELAKADLINIDENGNFSLEIDKDSESLAQFAEILGISEDLLTSLIDKSRQFVQIDTADYTKTRAALTEDSRVMAGSSTSKDGLQTLYVNEAVIKSEANNQGIHGEQYTGLLEGLENNNVQVIKAIDLLDTKEGVEKTNSLLNDIGLKNDSSLNDAIQVFSKMGFSLDETKDILSREGVTVNGTEEEIETAWQEQAYALENPTVAEINSTTSGILDNTTAMLTAMGIMTNSMQQQVDKVTDDDYVKSIQNNLIDSDGKLKTFDSYEQYSSAKGAVKKQISDYDVMITNLEQGKNAATDSNVQNQIQEQINKLIEARDLLQNSVTESENKWNEHTAEVTERYKNNNFNYDTLAGNNQIDQNYLNTHATEISSILDSGLDEGVTKLQELREQGVLSEQTIQNLGLALIDVNNTSFSHLNAEQQKVILDALQLVRTGEQIKTTFSTPFTFEVYDNVNELRDHLNAIGFSGENTAQYRSIIFNTEFSNEEKVEHFINELNTEFGDGETTKTVIIEAAAQFAAGNEPAAMDLLTKQFGAEKAKEIEQKLNVICDGSIANADEFQSAIENQAKDLISQGFVVDTSVMADIGNINADPISLNVSVNTKEGFDKIAELTGHVKAETILAPIDADTSQADSAISNTKSNAQVPVSIPISANFTGPWTKTLTIKKVEKDAKGRNNILPSHESISFNSFATGYNGPGRKGSKITALTGEKGYEVAWIPSEQRSTIFGVGGPEIATFPADTVIYNHEQSKKILKGNQNKIELGSFGSGDKVSSSTFKKWSTSKTASKPSGSSSSSSSGSSKSGSGSSKSGSSDSSKNEKHITINNWSIEEVIRFNAEKRIENYQNKIDNWSKALDKSLQKFGTKLSDVTGNVNNQIDYLKSIERQNNNLVASYQRSLKELDTGNYKATISYDKGGESQQEDINLSPYVYKDQWGNYQIDQSKIAKAGSKEKQEAIYKAIESVLGNLVSGLQKAQNAAQEARDATEELEKKVFDTFWGWKNEITEVYNLSQKIANDESKRNRFTSQISLELARLNAGFGDTASAIRNSTAALSRYNKTTKDQIESSRTMIAARERELNAAFNATDELELYSTVWKKYGSNSAATKEAKKDYDAAIAMRTYIKDGFTKNVDGSIDYDINWEQFEEDRLSGKITEETYNLIKQKLDQLNDASIAFNDSINDATELLTGVYETLLEYQKTIADFEDTLLQQLEKDLQSQIDDSKKLNDSIKNSLKDLLDQVKRKLDERRQKEDNAKTEADIANKQQRLALLKASTSSSKVEIAQLEKEIAESQQSYQRTLENQLLDDLQKQGDEAAAQRERLIEIAQAQLDLSKADNRAEVAKWLSNPELYKDQIKEAWLAANGYEDKGEYGRKVLEQEFEKSFAELSNALKQTSIDLSDNTVTTAELAKEIEDGIATANDANTREGDALSDVTYRNITDKEGTYPGGLTSAETFKKMGASVAEACQASKLEGKELTFSQLKSGGYSLSELKKGGYSLSTFWSNGVTSAKDLKTAGFTAKDLLNFLVDGKHPFTASNLKGIFSDADLGIKKTVPATTAKKADSSTKKLTNDDIVGIASAIWNWGSDKSGWGTGQTRWNNIDKIFGTGAGQKVQDYINAHVNSNSGWYSWEKSKKYFRNKYKKGGLAPFTGPAWLDGTKAKPELVLNAADTKNFIQLKDVLASLMKGGSFNTPAAVAGDSNYEININVDHINNDYDVDKIANRVKKIIVSDSSYRNVTSVRKFR